MGEVLSELLQARAGQKVPAVGVGGGQQSWKAAARSLHPRASGPHPPGGSKRGRAEKGAEGQKGYLPGPTSHQILCYGQKCQCLLLSWDLRSQVGVHWIWGWEVQ